eukprot:2920430-Rhodomonas_salina.2
MKLAESSSGPQVDPSNSTRTRAQTHPRSKRASALYRTRPGTNHALHQYQTCCSARVGRYALQGSTDRTAVLDILDRVHRQLRFKTVLPILYCAVGRYGTCTTK